jgi:hypothetical protein
MSKLAKAIPAAVLISTALLASPSASSAATQVGQTVDPSSSFCSQNTTWLQSTSPSNQYVVPTDGVITSWSFLGGSIAPSQLKLKVGHVGTTSLTIVGESAPQTPAANSLNTFSTRISVHALDVIGFYWPSPNARCANTSAPGYTEVFTNGDILPGATGSPIQPEANVQLDISALLEPDADHDGFGDQTQDQCPTNAATQGPCPVTHKKKKCKKHKKHRSAESAKKKKCKKKHH